MSFPDLLPLIVLYSHWSLCVPVCVCVLVSCYWQCVNETPSLAPAARDPCCRLSLTSSTWPTAMTVPPSPWQRMSSRSHASGRTVKPRRRWDTHTHMRTYHNASRDMLSHKIWPVVPLGMCHTMCDWEKIKSCL